jgi:hypothetical protein
MKIKIAQLAHLFETYGSEIDIKYFDDIIIGGTAYLSTDLVLPAHLAHLSGHGIDEIEIFYTAPLYDILAKEYPADFRKPWGRIRMSEMDKVLEDLKNVNAQSTRKRFVRMVGDICGIDMARGKRIILLRHNEPLDFKKWNALKRDIDRNQVFPYRNSEVAIIIFVDLRMGMHKDYIERFKINTDLISLIVSRSQEPTHMIAPDFVPTEDVLSVTEPSALLEEYIRSNARLIIIGEKLDDEYKRALLHVRNYDRFVRLMVVPTLDQHNLADFFRQVRLVYANDRWQ